VWLTHGIKALKKNFKLSFKCKVLKKQILQLNVDSRAKEQRTSVEESEAKAICNIL
jgi:hypothetical protein